jgi:hypothetical protein
MQQCSNALWAQNVFQSLSFQELLVTLYTTYWLLNHFKTPSPPPRRLIEHLTQYLTVNWEYIKYFKHTKTQYRHRLSHRHRKKKDAYANLAFWSRATKLSDYQFIQQHVRAGDIRPEWSESLWMACLRKAEGLQTFCRVQWGRRTHVWILVIDAAGVSTCTSVLGKH